MNTIIVSVSNDGNQTVAIKIVPIFYSSLAFSNIVDFLVLGPTIFTTVGVAEVIGHVISITIIFFKFSENYINY
jgi:hypothetical protein